MDEQPIHEYKGYKIVPDGTFGMVSVKSKGRGSVPKPLNGSFTSYGMAKKAVDAYGQRSKEEVNSGEEKLSG